MPIEDTQGYHTASLITFPSEPETQKGCVITHLEYLILLEPHESSNLKSFRDMSIGAFIAGLTGLIGLLVSINPLKENVKISVVDTIFISILSSIMLTGIVVFLIWLTNKDKSNKTQFYNECTRKIEERFS